VVLVDKTSFGSASESGKGIRKNSKWKEKFPGHTIGDINFRKDECTLCRYAPKAELAFGGQKRSKGEYWGQEGFRVEIEALAGGACHCTKKGPYGNHQKRGL